MGWVPTFDNFSENSNAPHKFKVSHIAKDLILFSFDESLISSIFIDSVILKINIYIF